MLRTAVAVVAVAGVACTATPAAERVQMVPPDVRVLDARLDGLTSQLALARIENAFGQPITIVFRGETILVSPRELGASARIEGAVRKALAASPHSRIPLKVQVSKSALAAYVDGLARRYDAAPHSAKVVGANAAGPVIRGGKVGLELDKTAMEVALEQELLTGSRKPLVLMMAGVEPRRTSSRFGSVVVINRSTNILKLYASMRLVRTFSVATGQSVYPTPQGVFDVVDKQQNPWWSPPASPWAQGLKPVPPGPGNPLGTRWMGLSSPGVGMHGTPNDASIGYSESHGCIRMHIPDAEWLFEHVSLGTPVVIL